MKRIIYILFLSFSLLLFSKCSQKSELTPEQKKEISNEVTNQIERFYAVAEGFNVDSLITFFDKSDATIQLVNGKFYTLGEFKSLLSELYSLRKWQKFIFEKPTIKVLSDNVVLYITKKKNVFELKTGEKVELHTVETYIWKKVNGKWYVEMYNGFIS